ncbi:hypothetical protein LTR20_004244 [Exophiala xenobiotica]|nr:hypothetical protein LTR41_000290 [Exophiala xenobiotica]KAK5320765.1 hypothetical protein LTR93_006977 [Exophiala xenobiotica]KAK5360225.1 hypothetical protein LTS13_010315 [Exophiala xenobiotica]KAK5398871.1 hypothetical protein LTR79_003869 [Exophiala xenobiotica]KAK5421523.1 hypothetical protein LTR90_003013 [Exophiala xenobiotica]
MAVVSSAPAIVAIAATLAPASPSAEGSSNPLDYAAAAAAAATALAIVIVSSPSACTGKSRSDRYERIAMTKLVASP